MTKNTVDFKAAFEALPGYFMVLQPDTPQFTVLAISEEMLHITRREKQEVVGESIFEVYAESPEPYREKNHSNLRTSLHKAIENRKLDQIPTFRYDTPNASGILEERYWSACNKPVLGPEGEVLYILHTIVDVSEQVKAEKRQDILPKTEKTYHLFMQTPVAVCIVRGPENIVELANEEILKLLGRTPDIVGKPLLDSFPEVREQGIPELLDRVRETGEPFYGTEIPLRLKIKGKEEKRYFNFVYKPYYNNPGGGGPAGIFIVAHDVTEEVKARKKVEEGAKELNQLANAMPQLVWIAKADGEVVFYNDRVTEFAGVHKRQDGTWSWQGILHPEDLQITTEAWKKSLMDGTIYQKEHRLMVKDGTYRWHLSRALPQKDNSGTVIKWYGTATDVHEQKESEEALRRSEEQLRIAVEGAELGVFVFSPKSGQLYWSAKTKELMGLPPLAEVRYETFLEAVHPVDKERSHELVQGVLQGKNGGVYENEFRIVTFSDGKVRWLRSKGRVSFDREGRAIRFTGVTQDITERKQSEEALELKNVQLVRINNDLDNFIYTASHDLKAPIINIEGLVQVLLRNLPEETLASEQVQRISGMIQESLGRFKKTIANLTEVVKLQKENSGEAVLVDLAQVVQEVLMDLEPMIRASGVQLEVQLGDCGSIRFSEKNLRSVVYNLVSNGIKYRSSERVPKVEIRCESIPHYKVLSVKDNGLGIENGRIGQLFTMFKRFHAHVEGTGIGLYMVKKMVENAGGHIEVESQKGEGSAFRVYFPK